MTSQHPGLTKHEPAISLLNPFYPSHAQGRRRTRATRNGYVQHPQPSPFMPSHALITTDVTPSDALLGRAHGRCRLTHAELRSHGHSLPTGSVDMSIVSFLSCLCGSRIRFTITRARRSMSHPVGSVTVDHCSSSWKASVPLGWSCFQIRLSHDVPDAMTQATSRR